MRIVGRYALAAQRGGGLAVSAIAFLLFEIWFTIPLPKGPLEALLGY